MLNMQEVYDTIDLLESSDTTYENCIKLASLYIIKDKHEKRENERLRASNDDVIKEINDILPSYHAYKDSKTKFQLGEVSESKPINDLKHLCKEIIELIQVLHSTTDTQAEREEVESMINYVKTYL